MGFYSFKVFRQATQHIPAHNIHNALVLCIKKSDDSNNSYEEKPILI